TRGEEGREVGERSTGGQEAVGFAWVSELSAKPTDDVGLEPRQCGRGGGMPGEAIGQVREKVGDRGQGKTTAGDEREVAGAGGIEGGGDGLGEALQRGLVARVGGGPEPLFGDIDADLLRDLQRLAA